MIDEITRRQFLKFMGVGASTGLLSAQAGNETSEPFKELPATLEDDLVLIEGLKAQLLIAYGDPINKKGERFGYDNDYIACLPSSDPNEAVLWVNHEDIDSDLMYGFGGDTRKPEQIAGERHAVGGSILKLRREDNQWKVVFNDPHNRRLDADTVIPFQWHEKIAGSDKAVGTFANCAGGVTPWGTILTCEENYYKFYGEVAFPEGKRTYLDQAAYQWERGDERPPEHYGWVVEVHPDTGEARKLVALGRFFHEGATCIEAPDGRCVVYSGDDRVNQCLYKFISKEPGNLNEGQLYVADMDHGRWLLLDQKANPKLAGFKSQTDLLIRCAEAAHMAGGTPLDRPEDIEIHPSTGDVYIALTNSDEKKTRNGINYHGSIVRLRESGGDPTSLTFRQETFLAGGEANGFSCPDNMVFDRKGNLWFTSDISGSKVGKPPYKSFGNNGLFYVPMSGPSAGQVLRVASGPEDAEFTGPCFSPDGNKLFLSVQHPGSGSKPGRLTSHWPGGGESVPRPGVVVISGPLMDRLTQTS